MSANLRPLTARVPLGLLLLALASAPCAAQTPLDSAFTYQGELASDGAPATGTYDIRFRLFDAATGDGQVGSTLCADNLTVTSGRFAASLDFGNAAFNGQKRFLEIEVRQDTGLDCSDATGYTVLTPRQELTAAPNATFALTAATATNASNAASLNGQAPSFYQNAANLTGTLPSAALSGTYSAPLTLSSPVNIFTGNGAGLTNLSAANIASGVLANARTTGTNLNTANTLVLRDASGNFSAGTITAALNGNAATASNVTQLGGQPASFYTNASNVSAGILANARTTGTALNAANTLVLRDAAGNFSAGTITANLNGNAATATTATAASTATTATTATNATQLNGQPASFYTDATNIAAGTLANARTTGVSASTANTLVLRDASGNFSAGTITANLNGNAATATTATAANNSGLLNGQNAAYYTNASNINAGTLANARTTGTASNLPSTLVLRDASGNFGAGTITGNLNGNATTATSAGRVTGGVSPAALPVWLWANSSLPINIIPNGYSVVDGTVATFAMRQGVAVVNWSTTAYATGANSRWLLRVRVTNVSNNVSEFGFPASFYFNQSGLHTTMSGNATINIPSTGNYVFALEVTRVAGGGNYVTDSNDGFTATIINIGQ